MGQSVVLTGMVLDSMPISDYDKRITILTKERGKITAFARGARRPNSQLLAATNPFSFGEFELFEGKSSYNVVKANIHNYFRKLTSNVEAAYTGFYFLEFAGYFCQENNDEAEMLKLLYQSFRALESGKFPNELVRAVFELKAMAINGEAPEMFSCIRCKTKEDLRYFSVKRSGIFCTECGNEKGSISIHESTRYAMQYVISSPIEKLFTFRLSEPVLREFQGIVRDYLHYYVNHEFQSVKILESLKI
uniref:DNA repair protein RecO n=1 Tax=Agathobacter sp. TaxID=2021311 RepID=UPI004056F65C